MNRFIRKLILILACSATAPALAAGGGNENLDSVYLNLSDKNSLQRGAHTFVNYCLSCHSAAYMRYERMATDLGIDLQTLKNNMIFSGAKPGDLMKINMSEEDAEKWFGVMPPDLSLTARSKGPNWIYTYLRGFYRDEGTTTGWNNTLYPNVAMPHVLYQWEGIREIDSKNSSGGGGDKGISFKQVTPGEMTTAEYDAAIRDLTNFMVYLAEPAKLVRYKIGFWVMVFMLVFIGLTYALKKEYWRDVH